MVFALLNFASLQLHIEIRPFREAVVHTAETYSYIFLVIVSVLLTGYQTLYPTYIQALTFVLVIPPALVFLGLVGHHKWPHIVQHIKDRVAGKGVVL